jgi:hypothetical protein
VCLLLRHPVSPSVFSSTQCLCCLIATLTMIVMLHRPAHNNGWCRSKRATCVQMMQTQDISRLKAWVLDGAMGEGPPTQHVCHRRMVIVFDTAHTGMYIAANMCTTRNSRRRGIAACHTPSSPQCLGQFEAMQAGMIVMKCHLQF